MGMESVPEIMEHLHILTQLSAQNISWNSVAAKASGLLCHVLFTMTEVSEYGLDSI